MTTQELINELRDRANRELDTVLSEAADRLEELDERVDIVSEELTPAEQDTLAIWAKGFADGVQAFREKMSQ